MTNGLPTDTEARRIGTHSGDGTDGLHVLEADGQIYVVGTLGRNLSTEVTEQIKKFLILFEKSYNKMGPDGSGAECSLTLTLVCDGEPESITHKIHACDKVSTPLPHHMRASFPKVYG